MRQNRTLQEMANSRPFELRVWLKDVLTTRLRAFKASCKSLSTSLSSSPVSVLANYDDDNQPKSLSLTRLADDDDQDDYEDNIYRSGDEDVVYMSKSSEKQLEDENEMTKISSSSIRNSPDGSFVVLNYNTIRISIVLLVVLVIAFGLMFACFLKWINCSALILNCSSSSSATSTSSSSSSSASSTSSSSSQTDINIPPSTNRSTIWCSRGLKLLKKRISKILRWPHYRGGNNNNHDFEDDDEDHRHFGGRTPTRKTASYQRGSKNRRATTASAAAAHMMTFTSMTSSSNSSLGYGISPTPIPF